ncbi:unnamed protein product [Prorocentrum cordatum]|uniref:Uncharacterized protein n=1 Tax=Prorocentrum cordatum TaxID=2364126 RepID=A0ABN9VGI5_9DINO|nr:unnamed protein product [Polarella glacialis]
MINRQWPQRGPQAGRGVIHYYVDPTVPEPFQAATKDRGVLLWQPAFAAVGLEIQAHTRGDPDWPKDYDVADISASTPYLGQPAMGRTSLPFRSPSSTRALARS